MNQMFLLLVSLKLFLLCEALQFVELCRPCDDTDIFFSTSVIRYLPTSGQLTLRPLTINEASGFGFSLVCWHWSFTHLEAQVLAEEVVNPAHLIDTCWLLLNINISGCLLVLFALVSVTNPFGRIFTAVRRLCKDWQESWCWAAQAPKEAVKTESLVALSPGWGAQFERGTESPELWSCPL